jgi:glycosyltransferase involved in cell wall biosynthesis
MKLSIIIPCYNEEKNIPLLIEKFREVISIAGDDIELVIVNNGSTDSTEEVLKELLLVNKFAVCIKIDKNIGYGNGILQGLLNAKGEYLSWTHADLQTDPSDILKAFKLLKKQEFPIKTFIKGRRKGRPLIDQFFTISMSIFESVLMRKLLWDINAQPNMFHRDFFSTWASTPDDFSFDLYVYYLAIHNKLNIKRFDVIFPERLYGHSTWNFGLKSKYKFIKRTIKFSFSLKKDLRGL